MSSHPKEDVDNKSKVKPSFRERNKYRLVLDSGTSAMVFYNDTLIQDILLLNNPTLVVTDGSKKVQ